MIGLLTILALGTMLGAITQTAGDVRSRSRQGKPGQWVERGGTEEYFTGLNQNPQAVQVSTVVLTDPGDSIDVTITINGIAVTVNTGTGLAAAAIGALLAAAINANPLVRANVLASFATVTLTLTGLTPGATFTVASTTGASLAAPTLVTTAASAAVIPFGRALISQGFQTGEGERLVALAASSLLTAQVITASVTFVTGSVITATVYEIRGAERVQIGSVSETSATSVAVTSAALLASLNTVLPANTVNVTGGVTNLVFTAEILGFEFDVELSADDTGASVPVWTKALTTGPSASTSIHRALCGVSLYSHIDPAPSGSTLGEYGANAGVLVANKGKLWIESDETISPSDTVFIELGVAADNGQFFGASSATRIALARDRVRFERDGVTTADSIAAVRLAL